MGFDVIVIGAGITGLTAAYELTRLGLRPVVCEAASRAGGLIRTDRASGFTIEAGPDSVIASKPAALDLIRDLGLAASIQSVRPPGGAFVLRDGRLFPLPRPSLLGIPLRWGALMRYDLLPWHARLRVALEPTVPARVSGADADESVASFFRRRLGPDTVDLIAQPLLGGIHAGDVERLSMAALFPRLVEQERRDGQIVSRWRRSAAPAQPASLDGHGAAAGFRSLEGGMATLVDALERRIAPEHIRRACAVARIERTAEGWRVDAGGESVSASALIVAAPAYVAASLFSTVDADAARLCAEVPYASTASVALAWPRDLVAHPLSGTGFVVARRHSTARITACTWVSSKWEHRAPPGDVLLRAFIGGTNDPDAVSLSDDELVAVACRDLGPLLGITAPPALARVSRWPRAAAQHQVGHLGLMARLDERLARHPGLYVAGSGFRAVGIPDCVADARRVAGLARGYLRS